MKKMLLVMSIAALGLAAACGDDSEPAVGGAGTAGKGGTTGEGGATSGDAGSASGGDASAEGGAGGSAPPPMCDPPTPPEVGAGGSSAGAGGGSASGLAIVGSYTDDFDGSHEITNSTWTSGDSVYNISAFDNAEMYVIARNDQDNMYDPCMWTRYDWVESEGDLYFCTTAYNAETEDEALETERPDDSDPANGGCNTFAWSLLTAE